MAARAQTGKVVHPGGNGANRIIVSMVLVDALASADTLDVTLPAGVSKDLVPFAFRAYSTALPSVELSGPAEANLRITNHNRVTGVTRLTAASSGVAAGATVVIEYVAA